jgi:plasmid stability protein
MHTITVRNVADTDMQVLREEAARRNISINDIILEIVKEHVERYRKMKAQKETA